MAKTLKQEFKDWYKSKTIWINALLIAAGVATAVAGELQAGVPLTLAGLGNIVLRVVTKSKIQ